MSLLMRGVVVGPGIGDAEVDRHFVEEGRVGQRHAAAGEVLGHREHEAVSARLKRRPLEQRPAGAAVGVERQFAHWVEPVVGRAAQQAHPQPGRRRAVQGVENVGGQAAHAGCLLDVVSGVGAAARRP
jgi:hypothetical protein